MKRVRFYLILFSLIIGLCAVFALNAGGTLPQRHMGRVESLHNPITITGWTPDGLTAANGHTIAVPGIQNLPSTSPALAEATKRGLEIDPAGHLTCLVRVYRWCGDDPITAEILRVDLSDMLVYLRVGDPAAAVRNPRLLASAIDGSIEPDGGWDISDYEVFEGWQSLKNENLYP